MFQLQTIDLILEVFLLRLLATSEGMLRVSVLLFPSCLSVLNDCCALWKALSMLPNLAVLQPPQANWHRMAELLVLIRKDYSRMTMSRFESPRSCVSWVCM